MIRSILLAGVGGQGILLAAKIIASAAETAGFEVCANEIHGMAQRGGSVTAQIRYGETVYSPLIPEGTADVLGALEHIEALRYAHFLKPGGLAAVSRQSIVPVTVSSGAMSYPSDVEQRLRAVFPNLNYVDCLEKALMLGDARLANTLLLGVISQALNDLPEDSWCKAIERDVKKEFVENNLEAFKRGRSL